MITSLRDLQAAPGVSREASKEDFGVTWLKAGSINTEGAQRARMTLHSEN